MIAVISLRRSSIYQRFEYSVRLEVLDEIVQIRTSVGDQVQIASMGSGARREAPPSLIKGSEGFAYRVCLKNKGHKIVPVNGVRVDYGAGTSEEKRVRRVVEQKFYLAPQETRQIEFELSLSDIADVMDQFSIKECLFYLRVSYQDVDEKEAVAVRALGGLKDGAVQFVAPPGDILT